MAVVLVFECCAHVCDDVCRLDAANTVRLVGALVGVGVGVGVGEGVGVGVGDGDGEAVINWGCGG